MSSSEASVVVRSREKGARVYKDVESRLSSLSNKTKLYGSLAAGAAVAGVAILTRESLKEIDALAKTSRILGISTEKLAAYEHAARLTGASNDSIEKGMRKLQKAIVDATDGLTTYTRAFNRLRLDPEELKRMTPDQQFEAVGKALANVKTQAERVSIAYDIFGGRNTALLNTLVLTGTQLEKIQSDTKAWGAALTAVDAGKVEHANDAVERARTAIHGIGNTLAVTLAPAIENAANKFADLVAEADGFRVQIKAVFDLLHITEPFPFERRIDELTGKLQYYQSQVKLFQDAGPGAVLPEGNLDAYLNKILDISNQIDALKQKQLAALTGGGTEAGKQAGERLAEGIQSALSEIDIKPAVRSDALNNWFDQAIAHAKEAAQSQLDTVNEFVLQREQIEAIALQRRQAMVDNAVRQSIISEEVGNNYKIALEQQFQKTLTKLHEKGLTEREKFLRKSNLNQAKDVFSTLEGITAGVASNNKALFQLNKVAAIANAIVNTYQGVSMTLAHYPWPLSAVMAAAHLAAGLAQVQAIRSASFGGGTTPSLAGSTPTYNDQPVSSIQQPAEPQQPPTEIHIHYYGNVLGDAAVEKTITDSLREALDRDVVVISPSSRQAAVIRNSG